MIRKFHQDIRVHAECLALCSQEIEDAMIESMASDAAQRHGARYVEGTARLIMYTREDGALLFRAELLGDKQ